jgi:trans-aconitate methyltransferase
MSVSALSPARRLRFELVAEAVEDFAAGHDLRLLDAGCGDGAFANSIARAHPGWIVHGIDLAADLLDHGRRAAERMHTTNVAFVHGDVTEDLGSEAYDAVVAIESLEEIPEDTLALGRMVAALRPGGLLVIHVPEQHWEPVLRGSPATWKHEVRHGYDRVDLASRLRELGLERIQVDGTCRGLVRLAQELRDRVPARYPTARRAVSAPLLVSVPVERRGVTWGRERALLACARRPCENL